LAAVLSYCLNCAAAYSSEVSPAGPAIKIHAYSRNFMADHLMLLNTGVDVDGCLVLKNQSGTIDPNHFVIPFSQDVSVTFFYENSDHNFIDFGWMLADGGINGTKHEIYRNINDNDRNGVLDSGADDRDNAYGDTNGDGIVNAWDNKVALGRVAGGTELVFYLKVDDEERIYYTKKNWNPDVYRSFSGECRAESAGNIFFKTYHLNRSRDFDAACALDSNWLSGQAYEFARDLFGLQDHGDATATLEIEHHKSFSHVIAATPGRNPNDWILGWEDREGGGDTDHNDLLFHVAHESGGTARLAADKVMVPDSGNDFFTGVMIEVYDQMPCSGKTAISYELLHDDHGDNGNDGTNTDNYLALEITEWDEVRHFALNKDGTLTPGGRITGWQPGIPELTHRKKWVDFSGLGLAPGKLSWKAKFKSREAACLPRVMGLSMAAGVATHSFFSRSSPVVIANMMYSGNYETFAAGRTGPNMRGHLVATRLYDSRSPDKTDTATVWDAGELLNQKSPKDRNIKFPDMTVTPVLKEKLAVGDGTQKTFAGTLDNYPLLANSTIITDQTERFYDKHTAVLTGTVGGTGTINRFTGRYELTFNSAPRKNQPIAASYSYYTLGRQLLDFNTANVSPAMLGIDNKAIIPDGYIFDFNKDGDYNLDDGNWLINWVRGYKDGNSTPKDWLLGAIDHSVPATATPPGRPPWLFGTAIPAVERESYESYQTSNALRPTVVYVGTCDGMLHAFDAGKFRYGDNQGTTFNENRGYFEWQDESGDCPAYCRGNCDECPDYGTGEELWAFIPPNLIGRLKNNLRHTMDRAAVDASPALADVYLDGQWKTVLLSAEGSGGEAVFCLDVTDPYNPEFMWEFADPDLFRSRSLPSVARIGRITDEGKTKWVAFFASGKADDVSGYPSIFMIDIADGSLVRRILLDTAPRGIGGLPNAQPAVIDSDGNGYLDRVYIGSDKGHLYKINIPDDPGNSFDDISHCVINGDFTDDDFNEIPTAQQYQPIYGSPVAVAANRLSADGRLSYKIRLFLGTGNSPFSHAGIDLKNIQYHLFAYRDEDEKGRCDQGRVHLEWFYELPAGQQMAASAFAAADNIYFGTRAAHTAGQGTVGAGGPGKSSGGGIYALSMEGNLVMAKDIGNITAPPLVVDEHLYTKSQSNGLQSFGSGPYNNPAKTGTTPEFKMRSWREYF